MAAHLDPDGAAYTFTFWKVGRIGLPGIPVRYTLYDGAEGVLATDSLFILVASALTGQEQDIREIKRMIPLNLTRVWTVWARIGGLLVLMGFIVVFWWTRNKFKEAAQVRKEWFPEEIARKALQDLRQAPYKPENSEDHYLELSRIVRRYLEGRFPFRALEMTTAEIEDILPKRLDDPDSCGMIIRLLEHCDLAKFASMSYSQRQWREDLEWAEKVLNRTQRSLQM